MDARLSAYREPSTALTGREAEVLELLVNDAMTNKEIGAKLGISEETVKIYMTRIMNKTGYSTRLELAVRTLQKRMEKRAEAAGETFFV